jgi:hypothetical protein
LIGAEFGKNSLASQGNLAYMRTSDCARFSRTITDEARFSVLLAFFVVGSALGQSPQPTKIRITTWNLE